MKPGREMDALVATKIFGLVPCQAESHKNDEAPWDCYARLNSPDQGGELKAYSIDIAAAWEVVEKMRDTHDFYLEKEKDDTRWIANFFPTSGEFLSEDCASGNSAPHAICLAALKAVVSRGRIGFKKREE